MSIFSETKAENYTNSFIRSIVKQKVKKSLKINNYEPRESRNTHKHFRRNATEIVNTAHCRDRLSFPEK